MFYDRMKNTATRLLTQYGKRATIEDLERNTLGEVMLVEGSARNENIPATLVGKYETIAYCTAESIVPTTRHFFVMNDATYKVIYVDTFRPSATMLLHRVFLSR